MPQPGARTCAAVFVLASASVTFGTGQTARPVGDRVVAVPTSTSPPAVVLTTDCGADMDDQWALAHLLLSREVDLRAVITTHAASVQLSAATTAARAVEVIEHVSPDRSRSLQVLPGSNVPLQDVKTARPNAGVDLLLRLSRTFSESHRLVVFVIGAATDVASALLLDRSIEKRVSIVAMGFNDWPTGGDVFNVRNDPLAWRVILDSDVPVVVGSSAVTRRGLALTRSEAAALMRPHGPLGNYLHSLFDDWMRRMPAAMLQRITGAPETWVVWDEVVVAYALGMARGNDVPRPRLQPDLSFSHPETNGRITWLTDIDTQRVWLDFTRKIDSGSREKK